MYSFSTIKKLPQVNENNYNVFEEVDATAGRIAQDGYKMYYTNFVRDLIHRYTSDVEKARFGMI